MAWKFTEIKECHNSQMASVVRTNLEKAGLDIPGTAYFDKSLDSLSAYYGQEDRKYFVLLKEKAVIGGVGFAPFEMFDNCAEMQKLYLDDSVKGLGLGYKLVEKIEEEIRKAGFRTVYLETHHSLQAAVHLYLKCGYKEIERPDGVVHSTMDLFFTKELF